MKKTLRWKFQQPLYGSVVELHSGSDWAERRLEGWGGVQHGLYGIPRESVEKVIREWREFEIRIGSNEL